VELTGRKTVFQGKKVIVNSIRDLSYRIAAEANIRILSTAVEQSGHSVVISDVEGIIEYANQQFYKTTGFQFVEINCQSVQKLRSAYHTHSFYYQIWKTLQKGKVWSGELLIKKADQSEYWVSAVCNPIIDRDDKITHYLGIMEDISEKRQSHEELVKARQQAEESDQLKSAFLANMSHEIRTPLNSIIGFTTLLQDDEDDYTRDEMKKYLSVINKNGEMLLHLVNDIIDISKIESGQMIISDLPFNFSELLDKLENSFDHMKKPEVSLTFQPWFSDFQLHTDFTRLVQILTNLITNAIKFTTKGDVFVGHSTDHLYLYMWVRDTGCGIPEDLQHMIFERFAQGNPLRDQLLGGTGLGLSITKGLVHLLGGDIWIKSEEHKGSTFYFKLLLDHRKQNEL
jgi:PAS domain S-box-containing protein